MRPRLVILGSGFAGASLAMLAKKKFDVTVIDSASEYGGGNLTRFIGGHPYTFGPRVFFTREKRLISFAEEFLGLRHFFTRSLTYVNRTKTFLNYPLQREEVDRFVEYETSSASDYSGPPDFESYWSHLLGDVLYQDVVNNYSKKMWNVESNRQLTISWEWVNKGTPIRDGDTRLYGDAFQGYPSDLNGYNPFFSRAFDGVNLKLRQRAVGVSIEHMHVRTDRENIKYDLLAISTPLDEIFEYCFGPLKYAGRKFMPLILPVEMALPPEITWVHYPGDEIYTRVTEFKKITNFHCRTQTLLGIEIPSPEGRYYPVQSEIELSRFAKYRGLCDRNNIFLMGRHGTFKYKGIPDVILDALEIWDDIK